MSKDRPTSEPGGCECMKCGAIFIGGPAHDECGECATPARESVADALLIVESYGPWGALLPADTAMVDEGGDKRASDWPQGA